MNRWSTIFWDVDTQNDFIQREGKLYIQGAEVILDNLRRLTQYARAHGIRIVASADNHSLQDEEISQHPDFQSTYPPHCLKGTKGQEKVEETKPRNPLIIETEPESEEELKARLAQHQGEIVIHKKFFDVFTNPNTEILLNLLKPEEIVVYGVALEVCDKYAVEGFLGRGKSRVVLVQDATRAIREETRAALLSDWKDRGVGIVDTQDVANAKGL